MSIRVDVRKFAKIEKASVKTGDFSLFVGDNNSGKTLMMELMYGIVNIISNWDAEIGCAKITEMEDIIYIRFSSEWFAEIESSVNSYLRDNKRSFLLECFSTEIPVEEITIHFENVSWDSQMKAQKLKQGMGYNKTVMYWFDYSRDITVEEKQINNTLDRAILHYMVRDGDRAYFSEEYIPEGRPKEGTKKPDITAILESSAERKVKWYIYDLKDTVIHANTAVKLCNQWHSGIEHIEGQYLNGLVGYSIESSLGVISRYWSRDMLQREMDIKF